MCGYLFSSGSRSVMLLRLMPRVDILCSSAEVVGECEKLLRSQRVPLYRTKIRRTDKVPESTVTLSPMREYSPRSSAAVDYRCLAGELMEEV